MSNEFSNNLPPSAKSYYFNYLQGFDWYKAQLLSLTGPLAGGGVQQSGQPQNQTQQTAQTNNATASSTNTTRIKIDGQVTNVDERNKTFSIQTNQGALTLKIPRNPLPPEGLRIEIDIPRPREGQQISFRPLPRDQQSTAIQQQISQTAPPIADEPQNIQPPRSKPSAPLIGRRWF